MKPLRQRLLEERKRLGVPWEILKPFEEKFIIHEYGEPIKVPIKVYALEEIIAEKLRAILQHARMLQERGWTRSRARDYYDLWRVLCTFQDRLDFSDFPDFIHLKCAVRNVAFNQPEDFFQTTASIRRKDLETMAGPLDPGSPGF